MKSKNNKRCLNCKVDITYKAIRCQACARVILASVREKGKHTKRESLEKSNKEYECEKLEREITEAKKLYNISTGTGSSYWYGRVRLLEKQLKENRLHA